MLVYIIFIIIINFYYFYFLVYISSQRNVQLCQFPNELKYVKTEIHRYYQTKSELYSWCLNKKQLCLNCLV